MSTLGLRNLTPADEELLGAIGVTTQAQFAKLGAQKIHLLLLEGELVSDPDLIYRLRGAEKDIDWHILADKAHRRAKSRFADVDEP